MEVFHCDADIARGVQNDDRFRMSEGRCGPVVQNETDEMPSGLCLWDVLTTVFTVMLPTASTDKKDNPTEVGMG